MKLEHRLALRNLLRNRRRTGLTAFILVATMTLMTVFQGLSDGGHRAMIDMGVHMGLGHLIVQGEGYADNPSLNRLIPSAKAQAQALRGAMPQASHVVPRLRLNALAQAGGNTVAITASGVQPEAEIQVSGIADAKAIIQGRTLAAQAREARAPRALPGIVIGNRLAKALGVALGDRLTLTVKPAQGPEFAREAFEVVGVFRTGMLELDAFWAEIDLTQAQSLARVNDQVSQLALYLHDDRTLDDAATGLAAQLTAGRLQMQRWNEAAPELHSAVMLDAAGMSLLLVIVYVVVAAGILNTIMLSVMNRSREFGVMLALGSSPGLITRVVFLEAVYLAASCVALGLALGYAAHLYFATVGLNFREIFGTSLEAGGVLLPDRFFSVLGGHKLFVSAGFIFALTLLVTTYPAVKASRLSPIQASRNV